ncbi:MAG: histidinol-phosphatase [Actinomycetota bacterium]|nr:histidinol-phosphatase [Actinomycetota bacterium]MDH5279341.1 histidinol-phosphatase [Actinomycetota bacterium]
MVTTHDADLALAFRLADEADAVTTDRFRSQDLVVETKPDLTPVSDADRACEDGLRATLARERPRDAVLGEEQGTTGDHERRWVLDPIDGTKNFVRGVPVWATLIALQQAEEVVVGVVSAPALGLRWWASSGGGAWSGHRLSAGRRLRVSRVSRLSDASLSFSEWNDPAWASTGTRDGFTRLLEQTWRTRAYGDFWSHMLVAEGAVDLAVEPELMPWDMAALVPIVTESGGRITALDGAPAMSGGSAVTSNGLLHEASLRVLAGAG